MTLTHILLGAILAVIFPPFGTLCLFVIGGGLAGLVLWWAFVGIRGYFRRFSAKYRWRHLAMLSLLVAWITSGLIGYGHI